MQTLGTITRKGDSMRLGSVKGGSMMLLVVVLMSMLLVLCTRMWRTTAYVIDIVIQKQAFMQKKWAARVVLNCGIQACRSDFAAVHAYVTQQGGSVTVPLSSYVIDIPLVAHYTPAVTFTVSDATTVHITGELFDGKKSILATSCDVCRPMLSHNASL